MTWQGVEGHDEVVRQFCRTVVRGRLASSYLFVGPDGVGKRTFVRELSRSLLCSACDPLTLDPCGSCRNCELMDAGTHPDWDYVSLPEGKKTIPVELFIGDRQHRGREGLCRRLAMKPYAGGRRIGVIDDADHLSEESANCLLKTLEEPPPGSVLILIGTNPDRQLPTIRSRCQIMRFRPLPTPLVASLLMDTGAVSDQKTADHLARCSGGNMRQAVRLNDPDLWQFRNDFLSRIGERPLDSLRLAKAVTTFVDQAGKEAAVKRQRASLVVEWSLDFFNNVLRERVGAAGLDVFQHDPLVGADSNGDSTGEVDAEIAEACMDRCLAAFDHIDRNGHLAVVTECWLDDLASLVSASE